MKISQYIICIILYLYIVLNINNDINKKVLNLKRMGEKKGIKFIKGMELRNQD